MSRGPLPTGNARRRNAPTIPTTELPAGGFTGRAPKVPAHYELGPAGRAWWRWAWKTPQAAAWDSGSLYAIARRAQLEDELAALAVVPEGWLVDVMSEALSRDLEDDDELRKLERSLDWLLSALQRRAGGAIAPMREMRELDKRLGLDPKAIAEQRWKIVGDEKPAAAAAPKAPSVRAQRSGLKAVDPASIAS